MTTKSELDHLKSALRGEVCAECARRLADDAIAPPAKDRCESDCSLFVNLPRLARVAREGEPPCGYGVFAKSLQAEGGGPDVVRAMNVIEAAGLAAGSDAAQPHGADRSGCERLTRLTTAVASLHQPAD
jgi:hypothetical protein